MKTLKVKKQKKKKRTQISRTYHGAKKRASATKSGPALLAQAKMGNRRALAQALSWVERHWLEAFQILTASTGQQEKCLRLGITGPPGAGKSTLVNGLVAHFRNQGLKVAVLAVDPSSPFSGGALLGDRVRMMGHHRDDAVFVRSLGSRGARGGIHPAVSLMARTFERSGFDIVVIETVGVGQTELEIMHFADAVAVVLVPESGDVIQTLKAGILEIAQSFIVNKADRPGADLLEHELKNLVHQEGGARPIFKTVATEGIGVSSVAESLLKQAHERRTIRGAQLESEVHSVMLAEIDKLLTNAVQRKSKTAKRPSWPSWAESTLAQLAATLTKTLD